MEIGEIFSDALRYPLDNIKALAVYCILGIILGIAIAGTVAGIALGASAQNALAIIGTGLIGIIIALIIGFFINGYELDIVKYGIHRSNTAPEIDFVRQFVNGVKLFVVVVVYFLIPIIIAAILAIIFQHWLSLILSVIVFIVFALAAFMGNCRLAKTEDLGYALSIGEAIGDISKVGIGKLILFILAVFVLYLIVFLLGSALSHWNSIVGGIFLGIFGIYFTFFASRAMGLLYSDV